MSLNIAKDSKKRVVIVGGGFGGLKLANKLKKSGFQVVLIDKNNYHQFPPLIYQVASAGMEPTSISFPFRKIFQHRKDFYFRMAEVRAIFPEKNMIQTSIGKAEYDYLVLAAGTTTNYFGNKHIEEEAMPMKNVSEAMGLRNALLANLERALTCSTKQEQQELLNIVIVGGGSFIGNIINYIENMDKYEIVGYTDLQDHGSFWGYNYLGTDDILTKLYSTGVHNAAIGVGNKLNNTVIKQKIFNNLITIYTADFFNFSFSYRLFICYNCQAFYGSL